MSEVLPLGRRSAEVVARLRGAIDRGFYAPGARLPTEDELCGELKVGRTALRRAMAHLAADGLVSVRQGSGTYVCKADPSSPGAGVVSLMYRFDEQVLTEVQEYLLDRNLLLCVYSQDRTHWNPASERRFLTRVRKEGHRALLAFCSPLQPHNDTCLAALAAAGTRVIHIEHYRLDPPDQEYLLPDYRRAGRMAAAELMRAGYDRMLLAGVNLDAPYSRLFEAGFAAALAERGFAYASKRDRFDIGPAFNERPAVRARLAAAVRQAPSTGIACTSLNLVGMVKEALLAHGIAVPEAAGLIGPALIGPKPTETGLSTLIFDRSRILKRAIDAALAPRDQRIEERVPPRLRRGGTIRNSKGGGDL